MATQRSPVTCHILDAAHGRPAAKVGVELQKFGDDGFTSLAEGLTDADGRCSTLLEAGKPLSPGVYKMIFETATYFTALKVTTFYPRVEIIFDLANPDQHYHIPLLLSPWSYTTYRGS